MKHLFALLAIINYIFLIVSVIASNENIHLLMATTAILMTAMFIKHDKDDES